MDDSTAEVSVRDLKCKWPSAGMACCVGTPSVGIDGWSEFPTCGDDGN